MTLLWMSFGDTTVDFRGPFPIVTQHRFPCGNPRCCVRVYPRLLAALRRALPPSPLDKESP